MFRGVATVLIAAKVVAGSLTLPAFPGAPTFQDDLRCFLQKPVLSCNNATVIKDTCCSPTPGGLVLATQFWDTYTGLESQGQLLPDASTWTIHGLWPDFCDGSFTGYCDVTRQYDPTPDASSVAAYTGPGIDTFISAFGRKDLLAYMEKYWISQGSPNANFWAHEFSKHATCFSTYDTACYTPYFKHAEVVDFFDSAIRAYKMFPTGQFLASQGIVPSNTTTYTLTQLNNAIKAHTGAIPYFGCSGANAPEGDGRTILTEVWYYNYVLGTTQTGTYKHIDTTFGSSCTKTGQISYLERTPSSIRKN
ncbi:hypothetical protein M422DRAFT_73659 [Sphaerobolus stellatus SS14]|nr:hypothetical protein M422DRAFT_73659 [Sphaerobolus stellatus SS14]